MRLYLLKDVKQDLFVDSILPLPQHQLNGIRFLYKHFKKKNPGVILNDPPGYGKCMQVVLFLKGIKPLLHKPVFVICPRESISKWKEHFLQWADYSETDIAVQSSNAFAKHKIFINTIEDVSAFCRRQWSIVIFENNDFHKDTANITKKVLHFSLNSEYKIWVTSVDIQAHLDLFPSIYHWLNPGDKTKIHELIQKGNGFQEEITKSIILEAFLEDILIRRNNFLTPFKNNEINKNRDESNLEEPRKRSRKCKDITGKKVKRSKKRVIEDSDDVDVSVQNSSSVNVSESVTESRDNNSEEYFNFINEKKNEVVEDNEMDVETFIRDQELINAVKEIASNEISRDENNEVIKDNEMDVETFIRDQEPTNAVNDIASNEISKDKNDSLICNVVEEEMGNSQIVGGTSGTSVVNGKSETSAKDVDLIAKKDTVLNRIDENEKVKEEYNEEIENNVKTSDSDNNKSKVAISSDEKLNFEKQETSSNIIPKTNGEVNVVKDEETKPTVKKDITEQVSDLEKEALNRYKGSILDSLFKR